MPGDQVPRGVGRTGCCPVVAVRQVGALADLDVISLEATAAPGSWAHSCRSTGRPAGDGEILELVVRGGFRASQGGWFRIESRGEPSGASAGCWNADKIVNIVLVWTCRRAKRWPVDEGLQEGAAGTQVVVTALREALGRGELAPGQRLVEADLAEAHNVTRASVRAA